MDNTFEMVAKTFQGLEDVLADELRTLGKATQTNILATLSLMVFALATFI